LEYADMCGMSLTLCNHSWSTWILILQYRARKYTANSAPRFKMAADCEILSLRKEDDGRE